MTVLLAALLASALPAAEVRFFRAGSAEDFVEGTLEGVGVDGSGRLVLSQRSRPVASVDDPFVFAAARHPRGWVLGTGNDGRVLLVLDSGEVEVLHDAEEPEIFAVAVEPDGAVLAAGSPHGTVVRIAPDGTVDEVFDPGETYVWDLARGADGRLLVATGTEGRLYAVASDGSSEVILDVEDVHVRCLRVMADGSVLAGTAGEGWIVRIAPDGAVRTLYDADQPEVVALAEGPDGRAWAALLESEASLTATAAEASSGEGDAEAAAVTVEVGNGGGRTGPRSEVVSIDADGTVESVHRFQEETVFDLDHDGARLWVATGLEGKVFSLRDGRLFVEQDFEERQVVAVEADAAVRGFVTTNSAAVFAADEAARRSGTYTSPPLDAGSSAGFGTLRWIGDLPDGAGARFAVRTGMTSVPDRTWSDWRAGEGDGEIDIGAAPPGRFVQWRVELTSSDGETPSIARVDLSYRQANRAPRIDELRAMDPGEVLVPVNFNPGNQVYEPAHPDRQGMFTTLEVASEEDASRLKTLWRKGYRTLRWSVTDPNEDQVEASLSFRPEGGSDWLPIEEGLTESHFAFDATALPDGVYRFKLEVSDAPANAGGGARTAVRISEPVIVDHTPPAVRVVRRADGSLEVEVADELSPLRQIELSSDAGAWRDLSPDDGLLDGRRETLTVTVDAEASLLLLRVMDAGFNVSTHNLLEGP